MTLTAAQRTSWDDNGYFLCRGWAKAAVCDAMIDRIVELARSMDAGLDRVDLMVSAEELLADASMPEGRMSKVFRVMRSERVFRDFATQPRLLAMLVDVLGVDIDCFLSQFIFKHPTALGQPWHQDGWYFRMDPPRQVGIWLACTDATPDNGPLWVVPGSHLEPLHEDVVDDPREGANHGYVEIQGVDTAAEVQVLMTAGDLLVFDSHLRHRSTDNVSDGMRAAMVYHYSVADATTDNPFVYNQDWVPVLRKGEPVAVDPAPVPIDWT